MEEYEEPIIHKRRTESKSVVLRRSRFRIVDEDDEDDDCDLKIVESKEMICSRHYKDMFTRNGINQNTQNGPLTVLVTQDDILTCPICLDLLSTPIFQCDNGHIVCSSCHPKLLNKCPFCSMSIDNIIRCYGLEKFIESISKISCKNAYMGCKKLLDYNNKIRHEETCPYKWCNCPFRSCGIGGLSNTLYDHFSIKHQASITCFTYDTTFSVSVDVMMKQNQMLFLQEQNQRVVFILNHEFQEQEGGRGGVVLYLEFVGPGSLKNKFTYQLTAETVDSSISLKSVPERYTEWYSRPSSSPRNNYITVPSGFADSNGLLSLSICINKRVSSSDFNQDVVEEFGSEYDLSNRAIQMIVVLTNPYVLICSICLHPLFSPCFQYETGNVVCSLCCSKVEKKCPKCFPIGYNYNRCRGLEKVIKSFKVSCKNAKYGCHERWSYNYMVSDHELSCRYALCYCPHPSCDFAGQDIYLYQHFGFKHESVVTRFTYGTTFSLSVDVNENHVFLQEQGKDGRGAIFILNHQAQQHGRTFYLDYLSSHTVSKCLMYEVSAKSMEKTVCLKYVPKVATKWSNPSPPKKYLTVPSDFDEPLTLSICISKGFGLEFQVARWISLRDQCS